MTDELLGTQMKVNEVESSLLVGPLSITTKRGEWERYLNCTGRVK